MRREVEHYIMWSQTNRENETANVLLCAYLFYVAFHFLSDPKDVMPMFDVMSLLSFPLGTLGAPSGQEV